MYNDYDMIVVEPKLNKKKVIIAVICAIGVLLILGFSIFGGVKLIKNSRNNYKKEQAIKAELARIEEEKKQAEEKKAEEERIKKLRNAEPLTEEQINKVETIYESDEKRVFLTFDDGPTPTVTPFILDLLEKENIKATFFVLGSRVKQNPELIKREFDEGHYIANHGYTHIYSEIYSDSQSVLEEYNATDECIQEALGNPDYHSRVFRFPGGSTGGYYRDIKNEAIQLLRENNIACLDWNALSKDADGAHTKEAIMENIEQTVGEKQSVVILMHDAYDKILTYETLPDVIQYLKDNGYVFKNLYDIL